MTLPRRKFVQQLTSGLVASVALPLAPGKTEKVPTFSDDEQYWKKIKARFTVADDKYMFNAANLCPSPKVIQDRVIELTHHLNQDVSFQYRAMFEKSRKNSLSLLANFIGADEAEIGITRNTSEANCLIAHGLDLKPDDEVIIWDQNHYSNREVWYSQSKRIGFTVVKVALPANPSSVDDLVKPFRDAITPKTKLITFSHISNLSGLALPAKEICTMANERNIMSMIDGAQSLGMKEINVRDIGCTFFTSSTHKWLMGPPENGVIYIRRSSFNKIWPNIIGGGWKEGKNTVDENLCILGQRNDPSTAAIPEMIEFHNSVGKVNIENRVMSLNEYLKQQIAKNLPKASLVTPMSPKFSGGVTIFTLPGKDAQEFTNTLYQKYGIASAPSGGIRLSPHIYNTREDVDYVVRSIKSLI